MLIATEKVTYILEDNGSQGEPFFLYEGSDIVHIEEGRDLHVIALTNGDIILVKDGKTEQLTSGIEDSIESLALLEEARLNLLIGTEPPHIYRLKDDGSSAKRITSFDALEVRDKWDTPWGGPPAVRSLAITRDGGVYADIHVGSIMRSPDWGETWEPVTPTLHRDVHQVSTCVASLERVYANTYRAVYISEDRGRSWLHRANDLDQRYGRAIVVNPQDRDCILATVSDGPQGTNVHGQLYRTEDAGNTWVHVTEGFPPSTRHNINTFHVAFSPQGLAWAVVDRKLYLSRDRGKCWTTFWEAPDPIEMIKPS